MNGELYGDEMHPPPSHQISALPEAPVASETRDRWQHSKVGHKCALGERERYALYVSFLKLLIYFVYLLELVP